MQKRTIRDLELPVHQCKLRIESSEMITYKQVDRTYFSQYDQIPMRLDVTSHYTIEKINRGLGGFIFIETPVEPYIKDFCTGNDKSIKRWERWDLSNWAFFMAFDNERPVGGATVASRTENVNMLDNRDDLAVLWIFELAENIKIMALDRLCSIWRRNGRAIMDLFK